MDPLDPRPTDKRSIKERRVLLAGAGLVLALGIELVLPLVGFEPVPRAQWIAALGITIGLIFLLWVALRLGWDRALTWDPHYLYVPLGVATVCLNLYVYIAPALRTVILMAWFSAGPFMVGLAGFAGVLTMSGLMASGYLLTTYLLRLRGEPISMPFESVVAAIFLIITSYSAVVFERLSREREERRALRRKLAEMAVTDPLTGLHNRRHFEEILKAELARIHRYGGVCSLAMIDVDFFKNYNDTLGHVAGDALLKELAALLLGRLRVSDVLARYGGDEFGLIMVNTSRGDALTAVERLRVLVEGHPFRGGDIQPSGRLTMSVGVAGCPEDGLQYEDLVKKADGALYEAKRQGRNRVQAAMLV